MYNGAGRKKNGRIEIHGISLSLKVIDGSAMIWRHDITYNATDLMDLRLMWQLCLKICFILGLLQTLNTMNSRISLSRISLVALSLVIRSFPIEVIIHFID